jgi:hypothetical protein
LNRRTLIKGMAAATAVALARPALSLAGDPRIIVDPAAAANPHAGIAVEWAKKQIDAGILYCRSDPWDQSVKLTQPLFRVVPGKKVFNWMTGYTEEDGVNIVAVERDIVIGTTSIATNVGYEEYTGRPPRQPIPDYFVRPVWLPYDHVKLIERDLPKAHIGYDMRRLEAEVKRARRAA